MELLSTYALKRKIAKIRRIKTQVKKMTFFQALHENSVKSSRAIFMKVDRNKAAIDLRPTIGK